MDHNVVNVNQIELSTTMISQFSTAVFYPNNFPLNTSATLPELTCIVSGICSQIDACSDCQNTTVIKCDHCSNAGIGILLLYFILLSIMIFLANVLIIAVMVKKRSIGIALKRDYCRGSLAVAQLITGRCTVILLLVGYLGKEQGKIG